MENASLSLFTGLAVLTCLFSSPRLADLRNTPQTSDVSQDKDHFKSLRAEGNALYRSGKYPAASVLYERGYQLALKHRERESALRFLNNLAGCRFALFDYQTALKHYLTAQSMALEAGDTGMYGSIAMNISSIRLAMGEAALAAHGLEHGIAALSSSAGHLDQLLIQLGWIYAQSGDLDRAMPYFRRGFDEADRRGDDASLAKGLDHLGYEYLRRGRLAEAEPHLLEAYRRRLLRRDPEIAVSYPKLGMLRHAQGDLVSALNLLDRGIAEAHRTSGPWPLAGLYHRRGLVRRDQSRIEEALSDFRVALQWSRRWRAGVLPSDSARTASGAILHEIHEDFLRTAADYHFQGRGDMSAEMFAAAEEQRAASLRESIDSKSELNRELHAGYWRKLAQVRTAETALMHRDDGGTRGRVAALGLELSDLETKAGLRLMPGLTRKSAQVSLRNVQANLRSSEALLSFHAGGKESYVWAITSERSAMYKAPGREEMLALSRAFVRSVNSNSENAVNLGAELYQALFGAAGAFAEEKPYWLIVSDAPLFEAPFAALVAGRSGGRPVYLAERHAIRLLPGSWVLMGNDAERETARETFLGLGDSVYNAADARWGAARPQALSSEKARLAGAAREIEACARAYGAAQPVLLKGWEVSRSNLESALAGNPAVLHIAAHVLSASGPKPGALVHLGLRPSGEPELLSSTDIARLTGSAGLVVLSGCSSGKAEAVPGEGLMGLTRAWLINGAVAVAAAYWPTPDDDGEFFLAFYRHLRERRAEARGPSAARALQLAQIEMLGSGTWRSNPQYWAAFFVIGRN